MERGKGRRRGVEKTRERGREGGGWGEKERERGRGDKTREWKNNKMQKE